MSRGLSTANVTASQASHKRPLFFLELQFVSGTWRSHNGLGSFTWGGQTWAGVGDIVSIGPIEEGDDLSPFGVEIKLSALNSTILGYAQDEEIYGQRVIIYQGFIDDNGALVDTPDDYWSGSMETMTIELGGDTDSITLTAESELAVHDKANGALFTDEDQQARYSGDTGFQFLDQMEDAKVQWGPGGANGEPMAQRSPRHYAARSPGGRPRQRGNYW